MSLGYTYRPRQIPNAYLALIHGTKDLYTFHIYKHIVPTKSTPNALLAFVGTEDTATMDLPLKLTPIVRLQTAPTGPETFIFLNLTLLIRLGN